MKDLGFFFPALGAAIIIFIYNLKMKLPNRKKNDIRKNSEWTTNPCLCGRPRTKWKAIDMNRPEHKLLLFCPECGRLWEEKMTFNENSWRQVDADYAKANYDDFTTIPKTQNNRR